MHVYTVLAVVLAFVMFRAETVSQAVHFYQAMFTFGSISRLTVSACLQMLSPLAVTVLLAACLFSIPLPQKWMESAEKRAPAAAGTILNVICIGLLLLCIMNAAATTYHPFIYFRF